MPKYSILLCRFPGNNVDDPDTTEWYAETLLKARADSRISGCLKFRKADTPITMVRNQALEVAKAQGVDFVLMIDNDMKPDAYLPSNPNRLGADPRAKPFFETALDFLIQHDGPAFVCSPYCGPPPIENVYVFRWINYASGDPRHSAVMNDNRGVGMLNHKLEAYTREDAAVRGGIEEVAAAPTGLVMFHTDCLKVLKPPYTYYEWTDATQSQKASTEDVAFTRDLSLNGVPVYCFWDCWSGHWKRKCVGKPELTPIDTVRETFRDAVLRGHKAGEQLVMIGEGKNGR